MASIVRRTLHITWETVMAQLREHADRETGEKMPLFYDRLYEALQILSEYFSCDEKGLESQRLYGESFRCFANVVKEMSFYIIFTRELELVLGLSKMSTEQLMDEYHR